MARRRGSRSSRKKKHEETPDEFSAGIFEPPPEREVPWKRWRTLQEQETYKQQLAREHAEMREERRAKRRNDAKAAVIKKEQERRAENERRRSPQVIEPTGMLPTAGASWRLVDGKWTEIVPVVKEVTPPSGIVCMKGIHTYYNVPTMSQLIAESEAMRPMVPKELLSDS